tara:strand:+ start:497 stop:784 length:288 start_codon:yes stop_codon:yes gene_type:complete
LNKIKEKKLNAIKLEIEEIKNFTVSNNNSNIDEQNDKVSSNNVTDDTLTLTKIIKPDDIPNTNDDLYYIKKDLDTLKSAIKVNESLIKEILNKIK